MKILVSGSSGLIGSALVEALQRDGHSVHRLLRKQPPPDSGDVFWDPAAGRLDAAALAPFDAVIHLAGENIAAGRWTPTASLQALRLLADGVLRVRGTVLDVSQLCFPGGGKPFMDGGPWFSISHSASRVAVAISDRCDVGLDLEDLTAHGEDREGFERWTAIEATLKAVGAGLRQSREVSLSLDLATADSAGVRVYTRPLLLVPGCVATLATREPVREA